MIFDGNCDSETNGEYLFYNNIKDKINVIFDVGSFYASIYIDFSGEVHYFEPFNEYIEKLKLIQNFNKKSYFNNFGLGNKNELIYYYPRYSSFYNRLASCGINDDENKIILNIKKGQIYIDENNITNIDFLKLDTEGYELQILEGFEDFLTNIKIIQFEYGGTYIDNNVKLIDIINYLKLHGFYKFAYLTRNGTELLTDFNDHYNYCNIVCINKNSDIIPY
jgi:FkbM family methyltransferase